MNSEFEVFKSSEEVTPPQNLSDKILAQIHSDLYPSRLAVFKKMALIQLITGVITLLFCPQFGIGLTGHMGLMGILMKFGDHICMAGCGAVFLGLTAFTAVIFLRPEELRVLKQNQMVQFPILALAALGVFICLGAPILTTIGLSWLTGSLLGGLITLNVGQRIRFQLS